MNSIINKANIIYICLIIIVCMCIPIYNCIYIIPPYIRYYILLLSIPYYYGYNYNYIYDTLNGIIISEFAFN